MIIQNQLQGGLIVADCEGPNGDAIPCNSYCYSFEYPPNNASYKIIARKVRAILDWFKENGVRFVGAKLAMNPLKRDGYYESADGSVTIQLFLNSDVYSLEVWIDSPARDNEAMLFRLSW